MVLQRDVKAAVYGYGASPGAAVKVAVTPSKSFAARDAGHVLSVAVLLV
jgi:hypothetical protein